MDPFDWSRIYRSITAVGIGMQMGDETSVGKPRAYINREEKIRIRRARFPVVEERTVSVQGFCRQIALPVHSIREYLDPQDLKKSLSRMQQGIVSFYILLVVAGLFISTNAAPQQGYWSQFDEEDPEALMEIIRLGHTMIRNPELENNKRGLDLGLSRGFSGSQAAKHLMGLAAANYAGGPGRRRRSEQP